MNVQLLPSSFNHDANRSSVLEQRLTCFLVDDRVAIDCGSLALSVTDEQRQHVRDIVITHAHIDHIATLPIFIDDLFAELKEPVRVHATEEVIHALERDVFNWTVYPRFSELSNNTCRVMEYVPFRLNEEFEVAHLRFVAVPVSHSVPTVGLIFSDEQTMVAFSSDTKQTEELWATLNRLPRVNALIIEASFPNYMADIAEASSHLTPAMLDAELRKLTRIPDEVLAVHLKPSYRARLIEELKALGRSNLHVMEPGRTYRWQ